ncbi:hypothetical protein KFK09_027041 [Dendrobium nobile]|uniref:Uncharacterized protein n=1 Tax=Dendrobium nobile TaxID=94219 RepID=A0A8T3AEP5_DENNO|nr:hypothetical protein KFK09_027041 [Dendrobium nobile]
MCVDLRKDTATAAGLKRGIRPHLPRGIETIAGLRAPRNGPMEGQIRSCIRLTIEDSVSRQHTPMGSNISDLIKPDTSARMGFSRCFLDLSSLNSVDSSWLEYPNEDTILPLRGMAFNDELPRKSIKNTFGRPKKVTSGLSSKAKPSVGTSSSHPATQTQSSPTLPTPLAGSQFYSPDPRFPSPYPMHGTFFYPYYPPPSSMGVPSTYPYPLYTQPLYYLSPPLPFPGGPFTFMKQRPETTSSPTTNGRMLIEPESDTFHPSKKPTHKIRDIIQSKFDAPYASWKKIPKEVRDIWFREFEIDFYWLPQHNSKIRENFEKRGSTRLRDMFTDMKKSGERALWISESVWDELTRIWASLDYSKRRDQNKMNRASDIGGMGSALHTDSSVPHTKNRKRLKEILGREPTSVELHTRTHQRREDQQWVDHRARVFEEYTLLRESQNVASEGSSAASTNCSDYNIWPQAVGGMHKDRIYGLGLQAHAFEGQTSSSSRFSTSNQEGLVSQQVTALTTELEQVQKSQKVMQMQQSRILQELHKIREQFREKQTTETEE